MNFQGEGSHLQGRREELKFKFLGGGIVGGRSKFGGVDIV
jgi:hypothetical protein